MGTEEFIMEFEIKNRWSGTVQVAAQIECDADASTIVKLGLAVKWAVKNSANLADAYLAGANLADANLEGANLARANLADANLAGANLAGANLARANLADAYLAGAYLARADLADANLAGANLAGANLADANLARANLAGADIIDQGQDSRGYRFVAIKETRGYKISAGCRYFTPGDAEKHYFSGNYNSDGNLDEIRIKLDGMAAEAKRREWA